MKKEMFFSLLFAVLFSFAFIACDNNRNDETMDDSAGDTGYKDNTATIDDGTQVTFWNSNRDYGYTERESFHDSLEAAVERLDNQIDMLEDRADNATGEQKKMLEQRVDQLKEQRSKIENRMNDWANITEDEWENFKSDINTAWTDVQDSYDQIARDIETDDNKDQY